MPLVLRDIPTILSLLEFLASLVVFAALGLAGRSVFHAKQSKTPWEWKTKNTGSVYGNITLHSLYCLYGTSINLSPEFSQRNKNPSSQNKIAITHFTLPTRLDQSIIRSFKNPAKVLSILDEKRT